jgi:glutathione S-transferase
MDEIDPLDYTIHVHQLVRAHGRARGRDAGDDLHRASCPERIRYFLRWRALIEGVCPARGMADNRRLSSGRMHMAIDKLRADLERLREEIARAQAGDRESLARLEELAGQVQRELDEENAVGDPAALVEELEEAITGFEARHPNLTAIVNNMLVALGSMGV